LTTSGRRTWLKLHAERTLHGTTKRELELPERWVWIGYLCLAADSPLPGIACVAQGVPYTTDQLCRLLDVPQDILERATDKMVAAGKIAINGDGIHIVNWERYQGDYVRKQRSRARVTNVTPPAAVTNVTDRGRGRGRGEGREDKSSSSSATTARVSELQRIYEANIGALTPMLAEELDAIADDYSPDWFEAAVKEALTAGVRSLKYVKAILERWDRDGFKTPLKRQPAAGAGAPRQRQLPDAQQLQEGWGAHENP
jgi:DnaD/phage-associated family protein